MSNCEKCGKKIYQNERFPLTSRNFHQNCTYCEEKGCNVRVNVTNFKVHDRTILCRKHFEAKRMTNNKVAPGGAKTDDTYFNLSAAAKALKEDKGTEAPVANSPSPIANGNTSPSEESNENLSSKKKSKDNKKVVLEEEPSESEESETSPESDPPPPKKSKKKTSKSNGKTSSKKSKKKRSPSPEESTEEESESESEEESSEEEIRVPKKKKSLSSSKKSKGKEKSRKSKKRKESSSESDSDKEGYIITPGTPNPEPDEKAIARIKAKKEAEKRIEEELRKKEERKRKKEEELKKEIEEITRKVKKEVKKSMKQIIKERQASKENSSKEKSDIDRRSNRSDNEKRKDKSDSENRRRDKSDTENKGRDRSDNDRRTNNRSDNEKRMNKSDSESRRDSPSVVSGELKSSTSFERYRIPEYELPPVISKDSVNNLIKKELSRDSKEFGDNDNNIEESESEEEDTHSEEEPTPDATPTPNRKPQYNDDNGLGRLEQLLQPDKPTPVTPKQRPTASKSPSNESFSDNSVSEGSTHSSGKSSKKGMSDITSLPAEDKNPPPPPQEHHLELGWLANIQRQDAELKLRACPIGTFLVRWSTRTQSYVLSYTASLGTVEHIADIKPRVGGQISVTKDNGSVGVYKNLLEYVKSMKEQGVVKDPILVNNYDFTPSRGQRQYV